jgi:tetratricopeptide (TPR) repeat protein
MRRWSWLLGLFVVVVLGAVWWTSRNAIRIEPLDAQRFAQMSETEQVEWLIEQILARSKRTDTLAKLLERLSLGRRDYLPTITTFELTLIGAAGVEYELSHWLKHCERYVDDGIDRDFLKVYQALLKAHQGDWQAAEQEILNIQEVSVRMLALAHLGRLRAESGQIERARRDFERAQELLSLITRFGTSDWRTKDTARLIVFHYPTQARSELVENFAAQVNTAAELAVVADAYRQLGNIARLRKLTKHADKAVRSEARAALVRALIEQGQVKEGLAECARIGVWSSADSIQIAQALWKGGQRDYALSFANAVSDASALLLEPRFPSGRFPAHHFGTVQFATPYGQVEVSINAPDRNLDALTQAYAEWGLVDQAERLLKALPEDSRPFQRADLACILHVTGHYERARQQMETALQEIERQTASGSFNKRYLGLKQIAHAYARLGDDRRALELAQSIPDAALQKEVLIGMLRSRVERRNRFWREFIHTL